MPANILVRIQDHFADLTDRSPTTQGSLPADQRGHDCHLCGHLRRGRFPGTTTPPTRSALRKRSLIVSKPVVSRDTAAGRGQRAHPGRLWSGPGRKQLLTSTSVLAGILAVNWAMCTLNAVCLGQLQPFFPRGMSPWQELCMAFQGRGRATHPERVKSLATCASEDTRYGW